MTRPKARTAQPAARTATPAARSLWLTGKIRLTPAPATVPATPAAAPASAARPVPRTAPGPRIRRAARTSGTATTVWPTVLPRASAATTRRGGTTSASTASTAITTSQLPATATAATLSRPSAIMTRDMFAMTPNPTRPGANRASAAIRSGTWSGCRARTCAAGTAMAAVAAAPSQDTSSTARVDPAQVWSNTRPCRADSTGNALIATESASTPLTELNTCQP
jgi:hypothetical protein